MSARPDIDQGVGIIFPSGMLGGGFTAESIKRGIAMGATAIAIDAGSTDSGPYYLGAGVAKTSDSAVARDLRILLAAARENRIPLIVGSCGTSGTDAGVDQVAAIAERIAAEDRLSFRMARKALFDYSTLPLKFVALLKKFRNRMLNRSIHREVGVCDYLEPLQGTRLQILWSARCEPCGFHLWEAAHFRQPAHCEREYL